MQILANFLRHIRSKFMYNFSRNAFDNIVRNIMKLI